MGDEAKQEQPKEDNKPVEASKEPKASAPFIIHVNLHCPGCAKKIHKYITRIKGVEEATVNMDKSHITIKGIVEHQAVCDIITKKTKRKVTVVSPAPEAEGKPIPQIVVSQVDALVTVELKVNMHCEGCAGQLKAKILRMKGVQSASTEFSTGKVMVTGTMNADKLVDYVYRRTKKQAQIVPQPEPEKKEPEQTPASEEKPVEEPAPAQDEKKEEKPAEEKKEEKAPEEEKKEETAPAEEKEEATAPAEEKKEATAPAEEKKEEKAPENEKKEESKEEEKETSVALEEIDSYEEIMNRRMHYYYPAVYVYETIPPPPQLFSDENPNACCIS